MASSEGALSFSVASVVEDILQQHGNQSRHLDLDARRAEEAAIRRYEAAAWLRKVIGVVGAKDLPAEPSEEEFRLGLRSGIILCNALNKVQSGAVQKVVESPCDSALIPDGAPLSAFQYFENVRNFLVAVEELGIPTFEASDLEQGGKSSRIVTCVLALKSFSEWKQSGANGLWKFGGNVKTTTLGKQFVRKNSEPFTSSLARTMSTSEISQNVPSSGTDLNRTANSSLSMLIRAILLDKKPEEVPNLVGSVLTKVVEEFEHRIASQIEENKAYPRDVSQDNGSNLKLSSSNPKIDQKDTAIAKRGHIMQKNNSYDEESESRLLKQQTIIGQHQKIIKMLKQTLTTTKAGMQFMQMKFHEEVHSLGIHIHGLAHAAASYHRVLEENRKLYNQVQDLKGSIRVYCRVRPFLHGQFNNLSTVNHIEEGTITISTPNKNGNGLRSFNFNKVFGPSATQEEVFADTQPLIRSVLDGYNVCIFAYGQTGSGKTFTMTGPKDITEQSQGVNYRALHDLFILADQRKDTFCHEVSIQMIEIYNEQVRDLLNSNSLNKRLEIKNSSQTGLNVPDASLVHVASTSDIINLMNIGQRNRAVGATALNDRSSRSHSCLTVHVQGRDLTSGNILRGCMHLVDLAGSERVDKSEATGDRLKEAQHINKSLSALGDVISSLSQKGSHVPYRNSKLTQLLQDSLGGQAKTLMFVHISPEPDAIGETISTLKFAERVATVELGAARVNKDSADVKELKEQIANLKVALARKDSESVSMQQKQSPYRSNLVSGNLSLHSLNGPRKVIEDAGSIEVHRKTASRQKRQQRQSLDLDALLGNSPSWPPFNSSSPNNGDDEAELYSGEWVDKLMVNKQDHHSPGLGYSANYTQQFNNVNNSDDLNQKLATDSVMKYYPEKSNFNHQFDFNAIDEYDEVEAGTSDSSEPDLLWQFNNSKLGNFSNGIGSKVPMLGSKQDTSPDFRCRIPKLSPSPSKKGVKEAGHGHLQQKISKQNVETKRKTGNRK